ncbi:MAG: penicillin-binding protein activator, partial [Myxococcota bacterium]
AGQLAMRGLALASGTFADARSGEMAPFVVAVQDSRSTPAGARSALAATAGDDVIAVVGPIDGKSVDAAAAAADEMSVPLLSLNPRSGQRGEVSSRFVFHIVHSAEDRAVALARHAYGLGVTSFAVLRPGNGYGRAVSGAFADELARLGGDLVIEVTYDPKSTSYTEVIDKLKKKQGWTALFIPDQASRLELIAPALAASDLISRPLDDDRRMRRGRKIAVLSTAEFIAPRYLRSAARYSYGAILAPGFFPDRADAQIGDFTGRYEQSFGTTPTALDAYSYDAALVVRSAAADGASSRTALAEVVAAGSVTGLTGTITFDERRRRRDSGLLYQVIRDGADYAIRALR